MTSLGGSLGEGGQNRRSDVKTVQRLLNRHNLPSRLQLEVDGIAGPDTIDAIRRFQLVRLGMRNPDGRVEPGSWTIRKLRDVQPGGPTSEWNRTVGNGNFSGAEWWRANQGRYPNSRRLEDLEDDFGAKVTLFVSALRKSGAVVNVSSTRRDPIRSHIMHYSWKVAHGDIEPGEVPGISGLNIEWDHGDHKKSRIAAEQMVELFNLVHVARLNSNHITGQAIDMTITWRGDIKVDVPGRDKPALIRTGPRNGGRNSELHRLGSEFDVHKRWNDPPHWSYDGR